MLISTLEVTKIKRMFPAYDEQMIYEIASALVKIREDGIAVRLRMLAANILRMDSGSGDAALLNEAASQIENMRSCLLQCAQGTNDEWVHDVALSGLADPKPFEPPHDAANED